MTRRDIDPMNPRTWDQYLAGMRVRGILRPNQPGVPTCVVAPPVPMWEVSAGEDGLHFEPIVWLRQRILQLPAYLAQGGDAGTWAVENWEYSTAPGVNSSFALHVTIHWMPIFHDEKSWPQYRGDLVGVAVGEIDEDYWREKLASRDQPKRRKKLAA